jgi:hypothetical protein
MAVIGKADSRTHTIGVLMYRSILQAFFVLTAFGAMAATASADIRSCVTINGQRTCVQGQHSVVQSVVNGKTVTIVDGKVTAGPMNDTNTVIQSVDPTKSDDQDDPVQDDADE